MGEIETCKRCIMDNHNDPDLVLDENGICNHCHNFDREFDKIPKGEAATIHFNNTINEIKAYGEGHEYDCIIGLSGGVDSTYLCYVAKQNGLRPLLVHCDNGWNSELSVKNIENICKHTGFDLFTLVIDWEEMKDIQLSFFKAGVVDLELPYDYALIITAYKAAEKHKIKYVLTGHNVITEGTYLPKSWRHSKMDIANITSIHRKFGHVKFKSFPYYSFIHQRLIDRRLKYLYLLNYTNYDKAGVKELIKKEFEWRDYGGKHYENIFTRFYQGYILKEKFGFDKRQFHLSVLVQSGLMKRKDALAEYALPGYEEDLFKQDKEYVIKKLGFTNQSFDEYMAAPIKNHNEYATEEKYWDIYFRLVKILRPIVRLIKPKRIRS